MPSQPLTAALRYIRRLAGREALAADGDGPLLRRFCAQGDEQAFAALVHRHGPLVQGVCRRVLGNSHAAEDAFQATFLVLLRRAAALHGSATVAGWLYTVAYRVALRARSSAARRRARETEMAKHLCVETLDPAPAHDLQDLLDEELNRLPQRYRAPVVLCYLEGRTNEEAARLLGWTRRSVTGRLARARQVLHERLTRRGVVLPAGGLAVLAGAETVSAAVVDATVRAATLFVAGEAVAAPVAALTQVTLRTMLMKKVKALAGLLVVALVLTGSGLLARQAGVFGGEEAVAVAQASPPLFRSKPVARDEVEVWDGDELHGTWVCVASEDQGKRATGKDEGFDKTQWVFKANKLFIKPARGGEVEFTYTSDPSKKPKTLDATGSLDGERIVLPAIYLLEGDTLTICSGRGPAEKRPTEFTAAQGSKSTLLVFQRQKPDNDPRPAALEPFDNENRLAVSFTEET